MDIANWFKLDTPKTKSEFFKGYNIFDTMNNSSFGNIRNTMIEIFGKEPGEEYKLPTVIVIGEESVGKSSLLEKIIKAQIFPRDAKICTRCPIHLKLNSSDKQYISVSHNDVNMELGSKDDIYECVNNILKTFPENNISSDEIIIKIYEPNMPTFEFYDLPGIVSYPKNNAIKTLKMCKKYLSNDNTLVLCVVPATITRLTSCVSIGLLREMNMEKNAIIAFTMVDRVQHVNLPDLVLKRLLGESDELNDINVAGCVAVINRTHDDKCTLEDSDDAETKWFSENILDNIPNDAIKKKIKQNINTSNLVKQLDELYSQYIEKEWKPKIQKRMLQKKKKLETSLKLMGICANDMKCETVTEDISSRIKNICYKKISDKSVRKMCYLDDEYTQDTFVSIEKLLESQCNIRTNWKTCGECKDLILNPLIDEISNYIKKDTTYVLSRFVGLDQLIVNQIKQMIDSKFSDMKDEIIRTLDTYVNILLLNGTCCNVDAEIMKQKTVNIILGLVFYPLICQIINNEKFVFEIDNFTFCENKEYTNTRHKLMTDIDKLKIHTDKISKI